MITHQIIVKQLQKYFADIQVDMTGNWARVKLEGIEHDYYLNIIPFMEEKGWIYHSNFTQGDDGSLRMLFKRDKTFKEQPVTTVDPLAAMPPAY